MAIDTRVPRSRRALLAAGLGGLGASILHALGRPSPAAAADGDPILAGDTTVASTVTQLQQTMDGESGLIVSITTGGSTGTAISASASAGKAIYALSQSSGAAIYASNSSGGVAGPAVMAVSGTSAPIAPDPGVALEAVHTEEIAGRVAIKAISAGIGTTAIVADASLGTGLDATGGTLGLKARNFAGGTAILAISGSDAVNPSAKIGVYGYANQDANARAIYGKSLVGTGVWGNSDTGRGLFGRSTSGTGVSAQSDTGRAVYGTTGAADKTALLGQNTNGGSSGVQGFSGSGVPPTPDAQTGVQGNANLSPTSVGVLGRSTGGAGAWGDSNTGIGVVATGQTVESLGLYVGGGIAMVVDGATFFSESGKTTIASGSSVTVPVPSGIGPDSIGFATLMTNRAGIWVRAVTTNQANGTITIYLNTSVPGSTTLGWYLIN